MSSGSLKQFLKKTKKNHKTMNEKVNSFLSLPTLNTFLRQQVILTLLFPSVQTDSLLPGAPVFWVTLASSVCWRGIGAEEGTRLSAS